MIPFSAADDREHARLLAELRAHIDRLTGWDREREEHLRHQAPCFLTGEIAAIALAEGVRVACYNQPTFLGAVYPAGSIVRCAVCNTLVTMGAGDHGLNTMPAHTIWTAE